MIARHWLAIVVTTAVVVVGFVLRFAWYLVRLHFENKAIERQLERHDRHIYAGLDDLEGCFICELEYAQFQNLRDGRGQVYDEYGKPRKHKRE